jgi:hypothetical protein
MTTPLIQCPKCRATLLDANFNRPEMQPCPACGTGLRIEVYPAWFRPVSPGQKGEAILMDGESSCFYHPNKKAVCPCDVCGRFLCALCDCEVNGRRICPACLEAGRQKQNIEGLVNERVLFQRQALVLAILPFYVTGVAAVFMALRYWKKPGSLIAPRRWQMPVALVLGGIQTVAGTFGIVWSLMH